VGQSFAEIFLGNCLAMGMPCVTAAADVVKTLQNAIAANPQVTVTLDLETCQVVCDDFSAPITMNEGTRSMLVSGTWDACGQLVAQATQVRAIAAQLPYIQWSN